MKQKCSNKDSITPMTQINNFENEIANDDNKILKLFNIKKPIKN